MRCWSIELGKSSYYFSSHTSSRWWFGSAASESSRRLSLMPHSVLARPKERFKLLISFLFWLLYVLRSTGLMRAVPKTADAHTQENKRFKTLNQKVIQNARSKMPYSPWIYILPSFIISVYLTWANRTVAEHTRTTFLIYSLVDELLDERTTGRLRRRCRTHLYSSVFIMIVMSDTHSPAAKYASKHFVTITIVVPVAHKTPENFVLFFFRFIPITGCREFPFVQSTKNEGVRLFTTSKTVELRAACAF